jgi:cation-transporting P-type ATPase C
MVEGMDGLNHMDIRPLTGSVIFFYDPQRLSVDVLMKRVSMALSISPVPTEGSPPHPNCVQEFKTPVETTVSTAGLLYHLINAMALSAFMACALLLRFLLKAPLAQHPLSLTGIFATLGAFPLVRRAWSDFKQRKRIGLFPFLTGACALAIATGEAMTALEIIWILSIGLVLEEAVKERARRAIREIFDVTPDSILLMVDGVALEKSLFHAKPGDRILVRDGMKIPVDGAVIEGEALVDEAHMSGRSQPEHRKAGDWVYAGTKVLQGSLQVRAERLGEETYLCRMVRLVEHAMAQGTEAEKQADILAARLTRIGLAATLGTFMVARSLRRAFSVMLVVACPCATVLAASTAVSAALVNAARRRIFIKGGIYLEKMAIIDTLCFDKTGTLTSGVPRIGTVIPSTKDRNRDHILEMAASAERHMDHPLAKAILQEAEDHGLRLKKGETVETLLGLGVRATMEGDQILVGNRAFMTAEKIQITSLKDRAKKQEKKGQTVLYVAKNGRLQGLITLTNSVRSEAYEVIHTLMRQGIRRSYLISGDAEPIVKAMARDLGLDEYRASILPEAKADFIEDLVALHRQVLMVGDGVNDALALSKATVGVAMGAGGSDVAIEAADIALAEDDLRGLIFIRYLSQQTLKTIEQNFWLANATNAIGMLMGASGIFPPFAAGLLHVGHTLGIMFNSARLLNWTEPGQE